MSLLIPRPALFGVLLLIAAVSGVMPAQAISRTRSGGACYEVVGRDLNGVNHDIYLFHKSQATQLASAWVAAGWTGVLLSTC